MADISFGGLATGLPTEDLVSSLMAIERRPLERLEAEKEYETKRLQAYNEFDGKLDELRAAVGDLSLTGDVRTTSARLSSEETITASSDGAATGSYEVSVVQLAQVQKTVTDGFSSQSDSVLGSGYFAVGDTAIEVNDSNNSLQGLMGAINSISGETGVRASIINDGGDSDNYHLVLTGDDASTSFSVGFDLRDQNESQIEFSANHVRAAQKAVAHVDGIEIEGNSNTLSGVIAGLTINLNEQSDIITPASDGNPAEYATTTLNVEADTDTLKEKISTFVSSYNGIMDWIKSGYDEFAVQSAAETEGEEGDASGSTENLSELLRGDATINDVKRNLQSMLSEAVGSSGSLQILSEIGISTQVDGTLHLNDGKLNSTLKTNFDDAVKLLAGEGENDGVMKKFNAYLVDETSFSSGMYAEKQDRYDNAIKRLDNQIAQKEPLIAKIEQRIRSQFNAMEQLVSNLNAQSDYLTQQMDMLSNLNNNGN